jgi:hypothetical protein
MRNASRPRRGHAGERRTAVVEPNGRLVNPMPERTRRHTPIDIELLSDVAECLW